MNQAIQATVSNIAVILQMNPNVKAQKNFYLRLIFGQSWDIEDVLDQTILLQIQMQ